MGDEKLHHSLQSEPFWSLPMTLAWIMWRSEEMVQRCWNDLRRAKGESEVSLFDILNTFNAADNSLFNLNEPRPEPQIEAFDDLLAKLEREEIFLLEAAKHRTRRSRTFQQTSGPLAF